VLEWLLGAAVGPAAVALPVNWAADALAGAAQRWFKRLRRADDLSRLVRAATGTSVDLTRAEFDAVRKLLEDQQTWTMLGRGTVEDLADRLAVCLPPRDGRTAEDSHAAALTIARGLIEFAVADLEPKWFQQVLMARLRRMETDQASALDGAMFDLHDDLTAGFASVMDQFKLVLDRLPPGPARRGQIAVYLRTLIDWLNTDPWPRDPQFGGPVLTPAAIERKLRITARGADREQDLDADGLAQQCGRLVILGGPGSGKTWLAKRTARRCAEDALQVLAAGGTLDEVELPLYTTCSRLFGTGGDIREAVVSSALGQLADLAGSRISTALRGFFTERNAPTLLVIDSLDEAHGPSERLHQASTLPWRIVLTSRAGTWRNQLTINDADDSHQVGELQPLRYPGDVGPFIEHWFAGRPEWGNDLAAQIARRPDLQQAATVPLILAFYCIIGGTGPLPGFRHGVYTRVLNRMLTGRWRDNDDRQPDVDTCLQTLRAWAWDGAASNHPVSGAGTWTDDIPTERIRLSEADADALDHVATPLGPPDVDTGKTLRRFIHRSIREHLVAEHVANLPVDQAVKVLLPHLWYDPDWEYAAPAALAMHPQHDQLVRDLICRAICRAASSHQVPGDLSVIDAGWEFRAPTAADLLGSVPTGDLEAVAAAARLRTYRHGQVVFTTGDPGDTVIVVVSGRVKVVLRSADGGEMTLAVIQPGGVFGELAAADRGPRSTDAVTLEECCLLLIPREMIQDICGRVPSAAQALTGFIAATSRRLTKTVSDLVFLDLPRRVAKVLLSQPRGKDGVIRPKMSPEELAYQAAGTRQSVNAALRGFQRRGWIEMHDQAVTVKQTAALARFAGS
jgi:CRP-like cAMP-binding protein